MRATDWTVLGLLKKAHRLDVPKFQRNYEWKGDQCNQLWEDILRVGRAYQKNRNACHFLGPIVYTPGVTQLSQHSMVVIDGQQRLTTIVVLLHAICRHLKEHPKLSTNMPSVEDIQRHYIITDPPPNSSRYKIDLSPSDQHVLHYILADEIPGQGERGIEQYPSSPLWQCYDRFRDLVEQNADRLPQIWNGIQCLSIIEVTLDRENDDPQLVFECVNSRGLDLSQGDLVRNFLLMNMKPQEQGESYNKYWQPIEVELFGSNDYRRHFDEFLRQYLIMREGTLPENNSMYRAYKRYASNSNLDSTDKKVRELKDLRRYAAYYCKVFHCQRELANVPVGSNKHNLYCAFRDIIELSVDVVYPVILVLFDAYESGQLGSEQFVDIVRLIESYIFRRMVCGYRSNSHNRTFAQLASELRNVRDGNHVAAVAQYLVERTGNARFPDNTEFQEQMVKRDLYSFRKKNYWLRRYENYNREGELDTSMLTVEHVMPVKLTPGWEERLGGKVKAAELQSKYLHTLGNLTLTGYNSKYGNKTFEEKRDMKRGFHMSHLKLNEEIKSCNEWNEESIVKRAKMMAMEALKIWSYPSSTSEAEGQRIREVNSTKEIVGQTDREFVYGSNHVHLLKQLRAGLLGTASDVKERHLKYYMRFDMRGKSLLVWARKKYLELSLFIGDSEIYDPTGMWTRHHPTGGFRRVHWKSCYSDLACLDSILETVSRSGEG